MSSQAEQRISEELAALHSESYGEQVLNIITHVLEDMVVSVADITLVPHERTLIENGRGATTIRQVRREFQETVAASFVAAVEHATGRRVIGFVSETHLDPPFTLEFFRLAPRE